MMFMRTGRPTKKPRTEFGERLAYFRQRRGISQQHLAKQLGVTQSAIANWERRSVQLNPRQLAIIAKVLDVSLDELFGIQTISKESTPKNGKVKDLFEAVTRLPRRQQEKIVDVISAFVEQKSQKVRT